MDVLTTHTYDGEQYTVKSKERDDDSPYNRAFILFVDGQQVITASQLAANGFEFDSFDGTWKKLLEIFGQKYIDQDHNIDTAIEKTKYFFGVS